MKIVRLTRLSVTVYVRWLFLWCVKSTPSLADFASVIQERM